MRKRASEIRVNMMQFIRCNGGGSMKGSPMDLSLNTPWAEGLPSMQRIYTLNHTPIHQLLALVKRQMTKSPVQVVNVHTPQGSSKRDEDLQGLWGGIKAIEAHLCEMHMCNHPSRGLVIDLGVRAIKDNLVVTCIELGSRNESSGNVSAVKNIHHHTPLDSISNVEEEWYIAHCCGEECIIVSDTNDDWRLELFQGSRIKVLDNGRDGASSTRVDIRMVAIG